MKKEKPKIKEEKEKKRVFRVRVRYQDREYDNQQDAREWAKRLLDAGIYYLELDEVNE